jgi:hypothetical protein
MAGLGIFAPYGLRHTAAWPFFGPRNRNQPNTGDALPLADCDLVIGPTHEVIGRCRNVGAPPNLEAQPHQNLGWPCQGDIPEFHQEQIGDVPIPLWRGEVWRNDSIKIAYPSADFRQHAVACLMAELFERHDRGRFEIIGATWPG